MFSTSDTRRIKATLERLFSHLRASDTVLVGSAALAHVFGSTVPLRKLNDVDVCVRSVDAISPTLTNDFAVAHLHWLDGEHLHPYLAVADRSTCLKVDIFSPPELPSADEIVSVGGADVRVASIEDIFVSGALSVCLQIERGRIKPQRLHDVEFLRERVDHEAADALWARAHEGSVFDALDQAKDRLECEPELFNPTEFPNEMAPNCVECETDIRFPFDSAETIERLLAGG